MAPPTVASNKPVNPVARYHERCFALRFGAWLSGILVLGLAVQSLQKPALARCALKLPITLPLPLSIQSILIFFGSSKPASETDPRPPQRATITLVISTLIWTAAFPVMSVSWISGIILFDYLRV